MRSEVDDLIARAMIGFDGPAGRPDLPAWAMTYRDGANPAGATDTTGWGAIARLQDLGSRDVLDACLAACRNADPLRRCIGAAVLGQLGGREAKVVFREERYQGLVDLLAAERAGTGDPGVLREACAALGHLRDARAIPALLELLSHPSPIVRFGVQSGLSGHDVPDAIDGLIVLSADDDDHVRDWATFGLGSEIETDSPAIRAALHGRLDDPCLDARHEAIVGLARRQDRTVLPTLVQDLQAGVAPRLLEAATLLAAPELCEALTAALRAGALFQAARGPIDLTEDCIKAHRACGC